MLCTSCSAGPRSPSDFTSWYRHAADVTAIGITSLDGRGADEQVVLHGQAVLELLRVPQTLTITFEEPESGACELLSKLRDRL